jgi:glycosyltransferase involved in cell wall biosynthesis
MIVERCLEKQVWLYGPSYDERRNGELLYNAIACVVPNYIGLTAIHSLSYGTPVITNDDFDNHGPEYEAIIDNVIGSFFRNNDVNDLVDKIKQWALVDAATRHECRLRARATVENEWSVNYQVDVLKKALFAE